MALAIGRPARASPLSISIYLVYWPGVGGAANEADLDRFMDCLLTGSSFPSFFDPWGAADLRFGGSLGLAALPPGGHFGVCDGDVAFVGGLRQRGELPTPDGSLPFYLFVMPRTLTATSCYDTASASCGAWPGCAELCQGGVCGLNPGGVTLEASQPWLEAWVTSHADCCWPSGRTDLNLETSSIQHEIAEVVANALGGPGDCGDGCEVSTLYDFTGCPSTAGERADFYQLQRLSDQADRSCDFRTTYTGQHCAGLHEGCAEDAGCCPPLACERASSDCCYPGGARCALDGDCCGGLSCEGGVCRAPPLDGGPRSLDAGPASLSVAGSSGSAGCATGGGGCLGLGLALSAWRRASPWRRVARRRA